MAEKILIVGNVLGQKKLKRAKIDVPDWGGEVMVRELHSDEIATVREAASIGISADADRMSPVAVGRFERLLIEYGWIDGEGNRVLADGQGDLLRHESARIVNMMADKIAELSGMKPSATTDAKKN